LGTNSRRIGKKLVSWKQKYENFLKVLKIRAHFTASSVWSFRNFTNFLKSSMNFFKIDVFFANGAVNIFSSVMEKSENFIFWEISGFASIATAEKTNHTRT
jgi:hypothetical protein